MPAADNEAQARAQDGPAEEQPKQSTKAAPDDKRATIDPDLLLQQSRAMLEAFAKGEAPMAASALAPWTSLFDQWTQMVHALAPERLAALQADWWRDQMQVWQSFWKGDPSLKPAAAAAPHRRLAGAAWDSHPVFDLLRSTYLVASHHMLASVDNWQGLDPEVARRLRFMTRQLVEAANPANFAALNPEVLEKLKETDGESLRKGLRRMLADMERGKLTMTDETAFEVGRNVASTTGKVIFENRLFQLIHYSPTSEEVCKVPVLIFPPWINKYYILDLTPEKSFVRWLVAEGYSVFMVSWAQASAATADVTLDHYVAEAFDIAIDRVLEASGAPSTHCVGYCVAGTTLAAALAWMTAEGKADRVASATYLTAQVDFSEAGDLLNFVDDQMLSAIEALRRPDGVFDGRLLAATFNLLRPGDLIWNYVVNNYLKGEDYIPFDLLYWNSDPTHVPARWHYEYIRDCYRDNLLAQPGGIKVLGRPIDLKTVTVPSYVQAGREDHIAPAVSAFKLTRAFGGPVTFMLAGSGHIAGVVNPPSAAKYQYWVLDDGAPIPESLEAFRAAAREVKGSWWPHWSAWLRPRSGDKVPARQPGSAPGLPAIEEAPGRYVKERVA